MNQNKLPVDDEMFEYKVAPAGPDCQATRDLLLLADVDVPLEVIKNWTPTQFCLAEEWATRVYLDASDNNVRIPKRPHCLRGFKPPEAVQP